MRRHAEGVSGKGSFGWRVGYVMDGPAARPEVGTTGTRSRYATASSSRSARPAGGGFRGCRPSRFGQEPRAVPSRFRRGRNSLQHPPALGSRTSPLVLACSRGVVLWLVARCRVAARGAGPCAPRRRASGRARLRAWVGHAGGARCHEQVDRACASSQRLARLCLGLRLLVGRRAAARGLRSV